MRIALVSDIHGNLPALEAVAADIRRRGADRVVNLGDNLSGPLLPRETAQWLMASGWLSLAGNHERQVLNLQPGRGGASDQYAHAQLTEAEFAWMRSLSHCVRLNEQVLLCHGSPRSDHEYLLETLDGRTCAWRRPRKSPSAWANTVPFQSSPAATPMCPAPCAAPASCWSTPAAWACRPTATTTRFTMSSK